MRKNLLHFCWNRMEFYEKMSSVKGRAGFAERMNNRDEFSPINTKKREKCLKLRKNLEDKICEHIDNGAVLF